MFVGVFDARAFIECSDPPQYPPTLAFEGATGFGRYAYTGGPQEPFIYTVTTLADYTPGSCSYPDPGEVPISGSLRYIIEQQIGTSSAGAVILFDDELHGAINLKCSLELKGSFVKILGQSAAEEGITIKGNQFTVMNGHDVVIQYLRFRSSELNATKFHCQRSLVVLGQTAVAQNIIIDHCSIGASQDDDMSFWGSVCHCTVQNCIIGGGVYADCKGGIGSGGPGAFATDEGVTFCHNLITNSSGRQMLFGGPERVDFYNNVVSNGAFGTQVMSYNSVDAPQINILYNWYRTPRTSFYPGGFYDPITAAQTYTDCAINPGIEPGGGCGSIHVPTNHEKIYVEENRFQRSNNNPTTPVWTEPYNSNTGRWNLTVHAYKGGDFTTNLDPDLERPHGTPGRWSMWTSSDLVDVPNQMQGVFDAALDDAGCRLPLSAPVLDATDQILVNYSDPGHLDTGTYFFPAHETSHNLDPGYAHTPTPPHQAQVLTAEVATLSWKQPDETETFKVYIKNSEFRNFTFIGNVNGVGTGNTASIQVPGSFEIDGGEDYVWRVDSYNGCDATPEHEHSTGVEWAFHVLNP